MENSKIVNFNSIKRPKKKYITIDTIKKRIQPIVDVLNQPLEVFYSKPGERFSERENQQIKQLVMKYTCKAMSCTYMAKEMKKYWPNRTESSLLGKITEARRKYPREISMAYRFVAYGKVIVEDDDGFKLRLNTEGNNRENFAMHFLKTLILEIAGLIRADEELVYDVELIDEDGDAYEMTSIEWQKRNKVYDMYEFYYERGHNYDLSDAEAAEKMGISQKELRKLKRMKGIRGVVNTRDLVRLAMVMNTELGNKVNNSYGYFRDLFSGRGSQEK